jgi:hypothetical protein
MSTIVVTKKSEAKIKVALIIEQGTIKPVWFEEVDEPGRDRIFIKQICSKWPQQTLVDLGRESLLR